VGRLCGGVDDNGRFDFRDQLENPVAVSDVEMMMLVPFDLPLEPFERPTGITFGAEKDCPLIVVDAHNRVAIARKVKAHFRAN